MVHGWGVFMEISLHRHCHWRLDFFSNPSLLTKGEEIERVRVGDVAEEEGWKVLNL